VIDFAQRVHKPVDDLIGFGDAIWTVDAPWWTGYSYRRSSPAACTPDDAGDTTSNLRLSDLSTASTTATTKKKHQIRERSTHSPGSRVVDNGDAQCMSPPHGRMKPPPGRAAWAPKATPTQPNRGW
jgi:hypothetical protein